MKVYEQKAKQVGLIHKCKKCRTIVRTTCTMEAKSIDNEHPEWYLRKVRSYRRINGGNWCESHYCPLPSVACPGCGQKISGKPIEGRYKSDHPCDARCTGATGHSCECSCGGANHGMDHAACEMVP